GDGAVEVGEDEGGRRAVEQERRGVVADLAGRPLGSGRRLRDGDREADLADARGCYRIEGTDAGPLVGDPEGAPGALRNAPGILEVRVGDLGHPRDVGAEVRLEERGLFGLAQPKRRDAARAVKAVAQDIALTEEDLAAGDGRAAVGAAGEELGEHGTSLLIQRVEGAAEALEVHD